MLLSPPTYLSLIKKRIKFFGLKAATQRMRLFVSAVGLASAQSACNTKCDIDTLIKSITNKGDGEFYVECNEELTQVGLIL